MSQPGILKQTWYKWRSLRLPWRKQWLVGADLSGNTFWEFKDALNANRLRRIVKWKGVGRNYSEVKLSPQWHQWLRHTREDAPSIQEQQYEVSRQEMMKQLAAEADERWNSVPSFLDAPSKQHPQHAAMLEYPGGSMPQKQSEKIEDAGSAVGAQGGAQSTAHRDGESKDEGKLEGQLKERVKKPPKENPWANLRPKGGPDENWQPDSWTPDVAQRGR